MRWALFLALFSGCALSNHTPVQVESKIDATAKVLSDVATDIQATNEMVAQIEADVAAIVKKQQQKVASGGAGQDHGVGVGAGGKYSGGAGWVALVAGMNVVHFYLARLWESRRRKAAGSR